MGRVVPVVRRPCVEWEGRQFTFSNGLGHHGTYVSGDGRRLQRRSRRPISAPSPDERWVVGRGPPYRHWIPSGVLSPLPLVLPILSVVGLGHVSEFTDAREDAGRRSTASRTRVRVSSSRTLTSPPASSVGAWQPFSGSSVNPIAIFAATRWELQAVRRGLAMDRVATIDGVRCHIGQQGGRTYWLIQTGVGPDCHSLCCGKGAEGTAHVAGDIHGLCLRARPGSGGRPYRRHSGVFCA